METGESLRVCRSAWHLCGAAQSVSLRPLRITLATSTRYRVLGRIDLGWVTLSSAAGDVLVYGRQPSADGFTFRRCLAELPPAGSLRFDSLGLVYEGDTWHPRPVLRALVALATVAAFWCRQWVQGQGVRA